MPKTLSDVLTEHKNQMESEWPLIFLYEIQTTDDPPQRFRYAKANERVYHGVNSAGAPIAYYPAPITHSGIIESGSGDIPTIEVNVANLSLELAPRLEAAGGFIGQPAIIRVISALDPENTEGTFRIDLEVVSASMTPLVATFSLGAYNLAKTNFPPYVHTKRHCRWAPFGSPECGYILGVGGAFTTCGFTLEDCRARGDDEVARGLVRQHPKRFGGKPGIPPAGRIGRR